ncbi:MAG: hypothetical protein V4787_03590 [Pseudomonadota bacterium]
MSAVSIPSPFPRPVLFLVVVYFVASLVHFAHNAEYIALYPNMPVWLGRADVYLAWLAVSAVGIAGGLMWARGWQVAGLLLLGLYGFLGLDGLAHYTLALCSEHSLIMNLTIWFEALAGIALAGAACRHIVLTRVAKKRSYA